MRVRKDQFAVGVALAHVLILAAYTLPDQFVPARARYWSQAYARVLFHQDWRLFAPDPPACGCSIQLVTADEGRRTLKELHDHFIWRRMCANACRYAEAAIAKSDTLVIAPAPLSASLMNMVQGVPHKGSFHFRLHRQCGGDEFVPVQLPAER